MFKRFLIISLIIPLWVACNNNPKNPSNNKALRDSTFIFDGVSLTGWEISNFGPQGDVIVNNGEIVMEMGDGCTGIHWKGEMPRMNYMISLEAKRVAGNDFFCGLTFPIEDEYCTLILGGWGGSLIGLSCIDGSDASENETRGKFVFENSRWYRIVLSIKDGSIIAKVDDQEIVNFNKRNHHLSVRPEVSLSKPMGITTWRTTGAIRNIQLIQLDK